MTLSDLKLSLLVVFVVTLIGCSSGSDDSPTEGSSTADDQSSDTSLAGTNDAAEQTQRADDPLDNGEIQHLVFMREEEKLARDVYLALGAKYPTLKIFGNIAKSEERHTCAVCDKLNLYGIEDPVDSDNIGVFSGVEYGPYFTEKYQQLVERGELSELEALYVGAFIEELDMIDIVQCPKAIIEADNGLDDADDCGLDYTDNEEVAKTLTSLLEGSKGHLRAFVKQVEARIGEGNYQAQLLEPDVVDGILGR